MPWKVEVTEFDDWVSALEKLENEAAELAAMGLYDAAGVVADAVNAEIKTIRTGKFNFADTDKNEKRLPSPQEKAALEAVGAGIAKFHRGANEVTTSIGFIEGYVHIMGTEKERMVAADELANAINSGTSFMDAQPFFRRAISRTKKIAEQAVENRISREVEKACPKE